MIDHILYADPDLERAVAHFSEQYGVTARPGGRHLGFGTRNALIGLDRRAYLELLAIDPEQDVAPGKRLLELDVRSAPRFAAWCARADRSLEETVAVARDAGANLGEIRAMSRARPDGETMSWRLTLPSAGHEGILPFYIDCGDTPHPSASLGPQLALVSLTLRHPDPDRICGILAALGEHEVEVEYGREPSLDVVLRGV